MKRFLPLAILLAGCAQVPPPQPEAFVETCTTRYSTIPRRESLESYLRWCTETEALLVRRRLERERQEFGAMAAAIVLGAASDALATHNFYVYRVPEARRYLGRN